MHFLEDAALEMAAPESDKLYALLEALSAKLDSNDGAHFLELAARTCENEAEEDLAKLLRDVLSAYNA